MKKASHAGGRLFRRRKHGKTLQTWTMEYQVDGREIRESSGTADYDEAQKLLRARLAALDVGTYVSPDRERVTVGALLDDLLAYYATQKLRSLPSVAAQTRPLRAALAAVKARDLTTARLRRLVQSWQDTHTITDATINRRLSLLRRAYSLGKVVPDPARLDFTDLFLVEASPLGKHIDAPAFVAILAALPAILRAFFEFAYLCGTRKGQLARTTWSHWNPYTREFTWTAAEVKAKRPVRLPLDGRPLAIIEALYATRRLSCPYVFHGRRCSLGHQPSRDYGCVGTSARHGRPRVAPLASPSDARRAATCSTTRATPP
jgi:integrase